MKIPIRICFLSSLLALALLLPTVGQTTRTIEDKDIQVVDYKDLRYPPVAAAGRVQGVVVVLVKLNEGGEVTDATALSGASVLSRLSVENARAWRFQANPERAAVIVYNFRLEGKCHSNGPASQMIFYPPNLATITACPGPLEP